MKKKDILILNLLSNKMHDLIWDKLSLYDYPYLKDESFYRITASYHIYKRYILNKTIEANKMYEKDNIEMLFRCVVI